MGLDVSRMVSLFRAGSPERPDGRMSVKAGKGAARAPRVLHLVPALFDARDGIIGGAERYALELARHMARETPTTLLSFGERERRETLGELKIRVIGDPWYVRRQR